MTPPARRDGTPDKKQSNRSGGYRSSVRGYKPGSSRPNTRQQPQKKDEILLSNAKPAKKQNVKSDDDWSMGFLNRNDSDGVRLQKVLAQAGVASRRHAEILIDQGRVEVNDRIVTTQGVRVDPNNDVIRVDGVRIHINEDLEYFVLNKPRGMHSTMSDELGRPCVGDLVSEKTASGQRLFHVGRLDADTEGLLLLTNDGELANRLMHPKYEVSKTYLATVRGEATNKLVGALRDGVELEDGPAKADFAQIIDVFQGKSLLRIEIHEGRKHIVRRLFDELGFPVERLVRTKLHTVQLGDQKPGSLRALNSSELTSLYKVVQL
ncbi:pseudouridine synthase [Corynebacterium glutamicum]|uniref:pseudouridine synthase n=1 Tax=Corynebacterium glutamicum TaxID=1718 RepID=UPI000744B65B|nr:pseudouridine synthase [Corynebacterium glutamicum]AMA00088.1 MFS transporter [Corynebacterium glutamicum]MDO5373551.1 pseudouridine synthase [Corynebacterium glutamicum]OKX78596.1 MFS transporter [Corynebacterium glutamicum]QDQ20882.1 rRNA pseudouridine synthase [Corynebacterium glutamicum]QDQ24452.1 rRNA pseudouridine synthase [Corynebacterium glutamicum]